MAFLGLDKNIAEKIVKRVEIWTEVVSIPYMKFIIPVGQIPEFILSFYLFLTGYGSDSFILYFPIL